MGNYLSWDTINTTDFSDSNTNSLYNEGYLFTRTGKGDMYQTRSLRIDLEKFKLSSENKRVLKKTENLFLTPYSLPMDNYDWTIGKLAKDFYTTKFGEGTFSANKVKELLTTKHNFNKLFIYNDGVGYAICYESNNILHYSYPFYELRTKDSLREPESSSEHRMVELPNIGMSMMLRAILYAKEQNKKYIYLGSAKDIKAKYKLQFKGLEWFDGKAWQTNIDELKNILKQ